MDSDVGIKTFELVHKCFARLDSIIFEFFKFNAYKSMLLGFHWSFSPNHLKKTQPMAENKTLMVRTTRSSAVPMHM